MHIKAIKKILKSIICALPFRNYIIFESAPDFSDNTKAVFDEMILRGLHKKYKMIWWVDDRKVDLPVFPNTVFIDKNTPMNRLIFRWYTLRAKCLISCNKFLSAESPRTTSVHLTHGTAFKRLNGYQLAAGIDYTLVASENVRKIMARELNGDEKTFIPLGYPRNDVLQNANYDLHRCFSQDFSHVIVWYPTYRQHKSGPKTAAKAALPILHNSEMAIQLNEIAKANHVLIVIKPHFAQDISYIKDYQLSNIVFINDTFFPENHLSSYEFVGSCDALITDYSSIYFDYLLCNKPVAVIWEDIEDYKRNPGLAMDADFYMKGAEKVYRFDELALFIQNVAQGNDILHAERNEICDLVNFSRDGKNSRRVVDFIVDKAGL